MRRDSGCGEERIGFFLSLRFQKTTVSNIGRVFKPEIFQVEGRVESWASGRVGVRHVHLWSFLLGSSWVEERRGGADGTYEIKIAKGGSKW